MNVNGHADCKAKLAEMVRRESSLDALLRGLGYTEGSLYQRIADLDSDRRDAQQRLAALVEAVLRYKRTWNASGPAWSLGALVGAKTRMFAMASNFESTGPVRDREASGTVASAVAGSHHAAGQSCGSHPEDVCGDCGANNPTWFAPNDLWNRVMGSPNGIVCPACFIERAELVGVGRSAWRVEPEALRTALAAARTASLTPIQDNINANGGVYVGPGKIAMPQALGGVAGEVAVTLAKGPAHILTPEFIRQTILEAMRRAPEFDRYIRGSFSVPGSMHGAGSATDVIGWLGSDGYRTIVDKDARAAARTAAPSCGTGGGNDTGDVTQPVAVVGPTPAAPATTREDAPVCGLCGEPMPKGEEMFQYHGFSGPCPQPPTPAPCPEQRLGTHQWMFGKDGSEQCECVLCGAKGRIVEVPK